MLQPIKSYCQIYIHNNLFQMEMRLLEVEADGLNQPNYNQRVNQSRNIRMMRHRQSAGNNQIFNKSGHWSQKENAKYYAFLQKFQEKFSEKQSRRQWKVFKALSEFVKTRNANQCRSHHHKMNKNFTSIEETLQFLSKKNPSLKIKAEKYAEQLSKIDVCTVQDGAFPQNFTKACNEKPQRVENKERNFMDEGGFDFKHSSKFDIGNLKTDVCYNGAALQLPLAGLIPPAPSSFGFPTTGLLNNSTGLLNSSTSLFTSKLPQVSGFQYDNYMVDYDKIDQPSCLTERQKKWIECHQYFIKWVNKVNSLIN